MNNYNDVLKIGIIGGDEITRDLILKAYRHYKTKHISAQITAVADPNEDAPAMIVGRELGIFTTTDYHDFYKPEIGINQIFIFTPDDKILEDVINTRPPDICFVAHPGSLLFWDMIQHDEKRITTQRDELETIINGIRDGIVVIDDNYKIVQANKPLLERMGFSEDDVVGRNCHEVFHHSLAPCRPPEHPCPLESARKLDEPVRAIHTHQTLEGEERIIDLTIHPFKDLDGKINRFVEITRDITERYKAREEMTRRLEKAVEERTQQLEETHRKLIQQDKMTSLGKLSASVVHELNNPLSGILTFNRLIRRTIMEKYLSADVMMTIIDQLKLMETETVRCSKIVSNLLAFARQSKVEPEVADINELIEKVLDLNAHHLSLHHIEIIKEYQQKIPRLYCDLNQIQQVMINLIFNATESMSETKTGQLILSTDYDEKEDLIEIRIKDTGSGISESDLPHIFEPFFTTKHEGKGVGLGLSVVYGIIKEHRGQIDVEKTGPSGTTFLIRLPAYHPQS
ncbi:MAG: PAS domain-containing protein [Deltaproteobacteria bacterium]|nr:PAS domain-containing protein [Deltaproteobacteria bacterium]MBW2140361.1 PAS domain-containing protein [Deltaproteobacteria bacterium]